MSASISVDDPAGSTPLTPRSKVRAMMAHIDALSDEDRPEGPPGNRVSSDVSIDLSSSEGNDEESDVPIPRGRLAGRLRPVELDTQKSKSIASTDADLGAYERVRREIREQRFSKGDSKPDQSHDKLEASANSGMTKRLFTSKKINYTNTQNVTELASGSSEQIQAKPSALSTQEGYNTDKTPELHSTDLVEASDNSSDSEAKQSGRGTERFHALVAKKRAEREKREEAENKLREERRERRLQQSSDRLEEIMVEDVGADGDDVNASKTLSSQVRPTRKASKKAIEEMNRETQRMSRNMQLTHDARTRKKYSVDDLIEKMKSRRATETPIASAAHPPSSSIPGTSRPTSDVEADYQTPPSSPVTSEVRQKSDSHAQTEATFQSLPVYIADENQIDTYQFDEEILALNSIITTRDKNKRREDTSGLFAATTRAFAINGGKTERAIETRIRKNFRVKLSSKSPAPQLPLVDSDSGSDLDIGPANSLVEKLDRIFSRLPAKNQDTDARIKQKALAHLRSPTKRNGRFLKHSLPVGQMNDELQRRARRQAAAERAERIEGLKAKGVIVQTAEEREKDQILTENLLEKARREVEELTKREKAERKKEDAGNDDDTKLMELDDSDDESYIGSNDISDADNEEDNEDSEGSVLSGPEEDDEDAENGNDNAGTRFKSQALPLAEIFRDNQAKDLESYRDKETPFHDMERSTIRNLEQPDREKRRTRMIVDDEEEEENAREAIPAVETLHEKSLEAEAMHHLVINPFKNTKNDTAFGAVPIGLSQAFAATMEDSQLDSDGDNTQMSSTLAHSMPEPDLPITDPQKIAAERSKIITRIDDLVSPLPPTQYSPEHTQQGGTQYSEMPEPTQDTGIYSTSPLARRFVSQPLSTIDTVLIARIEDEDEDEGKVASPRRRGRLIRRSAAVQDETEDVRGSSAGQGTGASLELPVATKDNAFTSMKRAEKRRSRLETFNKKKSNAREMIQEQAEESEDEYAGIGGASDDDSGEEMDDETQKMFDDGQVELNESQLAAFHANKERAADEKAIEKLYKDINSGMLRRKRGAAEGFDDLSDSDEELERRRRTKRAEFAKMRKALLEDENIGKIAENPKKAAFLKAIEDREDDDDGGFLDEPNVTSNLVRENSIQEVPNSQPEATKENNDDAAQASKKRKRALEEINPNARLPASLRRTKDNSRKPMTMADIRESVSFLVEEPHLQGVVQVTATPDIEDKDHSQFPSRRQSDLVVDRLSLKRAESSETGSMGGRQAFLSREQTDHGFRTPALLKRATTQSSNGGEVVHSTERVAGGRSYPDGEYVRRGGSRKSNLAHFAREAERRKAVEKIEMRRDIERKRTTEGRRGILNGLRGGTFD